jgi:hypothetical protein
MHSEKTIGPQPGAAFVRVKEHKGPIASILLAIFAFGLVFPFPLFAQGMGGGGPPPATQKDFLESADNSKLVAVVEVQKVDSSSTTAQGILLERKSDELYLRTTQPITVLWDQKTRFIMGDAGDIAVGGVIHATGTKNGTSINAKQVVVLTGYVKVK